MGTGGTTLLKRWTMPSPEFDSRLIPEHSNATPVDIMMSIKAVFIVLFISACGASGPISRSVAPTPHEATSGPKILSQADVEQAILRTVQQMKLLMHADGQFTYRFHLDDSVEYTPKYNMLRHAGAMYALDQYLSLFKDETVVATIQNGARFMKQCCFKPIPNTSTRTIWKLTSPEASDVETAKLGGAGLGLIAAVVSSNQDTNVVFSIEELRQIGEFILFMQKEDGSFYSKYAASTAARDDSWTSLYYPGEAALGLLYLNGMSPHPKWVEAANRALLHLARTRKEQRDVPHDHWALIATSKLLAVADNAEVSVADRRTHITHVIQLCLAIIESQELTDGSAVHGAFDPFGKTTPAATRVEGLVAAWQVLPDSHRELKKRIWTAVNAGVAFLVRAQVQSGVHSGAFPRAIASMTDNDKEARRFNSRMNEVRIDYLQHALSAMLGWLKVRQAAPESN
ncbi:MAG: hypothetical protein JXX14_17185 [Deltaproteobacteria bacterium]|nr:hypothetical protein [Deltaproteobacteria bacterium]